MALDSAVTKEQRQITTIQMIHGFRTEMKMNEKDWYKFCLRYSTRSITTVLLFFEDMYATLPYGFGKALRGEMTASVREYKGS